MGLLSKVLKVGGVLAAPATGGASLVVTGAAVVADRGKKKDEPVGEYEYYTVSVRSFARTVNPKRIDEALNKMTAAGWEPVNMASPEAMSTGIFAGNTKLHEARLTFRRVRKPGNPKAPVGHEY